MTIKTELLDSEMGGPSTVYKDKVRTSGRVRNGAKNSKRFFLEQTCFRQFSILLIFVYFRWKLHLNENSFASLLYSTPP